MAKAGSQLQFHVGGTQLYPTKLWHIGMDMSNVLKRDWHDYELIAKDAQRTGNYLVAKFNQWILFSSISGIVSKEFVSEGGKNI